MKSIADEVDDDDGDEKPVEPAMTVKAMASDAKSNEDEAEVEDEVKEEEEKHGAKTEL